VNNRIISVAVFALAAAAGLVLLRSPAPPPAPAPIDPSRLGVPIAPPDAAPGSAESLVVTAALPRGGFVAARLTDDLSDLAAAYEGRLPEVETALRELGLQSAGDPLVLAEGVWGKDGTARLLLPIHGSPDPNTLDYAGLEWFRLEGGDAMSLPMGNGDLVRLVQKADEVLKRVATSDQSPSGGPRLYQLTPSGKGYELLATLDIRERD